MTMMAENSRREYQIKWQSIRKLSELTRAEWIAYEWIEVTSWDDEERLYLSARLRTPDEAALAADNWDKTIEARMAVLNGQ